ncbi:MAG: SIS domain-containing protein [Candidatus Auribacterota bacterium]|nr:SIS domain-containing protein [Candidatus Auribacterota bacterium]
MKYENIIKNTFDETIVALKHSSTKLPDDISKVAEGIVSALKAGRKLMLCGCGGSAADAQHMAAELVGRFEKDREPCSAVALSTDTSILTSISNDYSFDKVYEKQVKALGKQGDILFAISTSGNSEVILNAALAASSKGIRVFSLLGRDGGKIKDISDLSIIVPFDITARVQEIHSVIIHIICKIVENELFGK